MDKLCILSFLTLMRDYECNLRCYKELFCPEQIAASLPKFTIWLLIIEAIKGFEKVVP